MSCFPWLAGDWMDGLSGCPYMFLPLDCLAKAYWMPLWDALVGWLGFLQRLTRGMGVTRSPRLRRASRVAAAFRS